MRKDKLMRLALTCVVLAGCGTPAMAAEKVGIVVAAVGNANAAGPAGSRRLRENSDIFEDDRITVGGGNVQIILDDQTRLVVGPSSSLVIDQFVRRDKNKASKVALKALRGTYRVITGNSAKSAYRINTAQATIGIRGTAFDFWTKEKTGALVLRGTVRLSGANAGFVDIRSGCNMGLATPNEANIQNSVERNKLIRENLPFILDQSTLKRRFRLDVITCRLVQPSDNNEGRSQDDSRNK